MKHPVIDPTSFVSSDFEIAEGVVIGRNCTLAGRGRIGAGTRLGHNVVIDGEVTIGDDCVIGHAAILRNRVSMGERNQVFAHCVIGEAAQHPDLPVMSGGVEIGNGNTFREFVTIHAPTVEAATRIGNDCFVMAYCHIAHDCLLGDHVKMANAATLAGHVTVGDFAYLALHSIVHQRMEIGEQTMIGMNSAIVRHVPPFAVMGADRFLKINAYGLERRGFSPDAIQAISKYYGFSAAGDAVTDHEATRPIREFFARREGERTYQPSRKRSQEVDSADDE